MTEIYGMFRSIIDEIRTSSPSELPKWKEFQQSYHKDIEVRFSICHIITRCRACVEAGTVVVLYVCMCRSVTVQHSETAFWPLSNYIKQKRSF